MSVPVYTIEMAYARMRELQELADRSRAHRPTTARRAGKKPSAKKR
ncbi:hypothetical protein ACIQNU_29865 [Streptomyces sp. NPDC091292]